MRQLSFTVVLLLIASIVVAQSPHGKGFQFDCTKCHTSKSWTVDRSTMQFDHDSTAYKLIGQHKYVNCRSCHISLEFKTIQSECKDCHADVHNKTVGNECIRCHSPNSWNVEKILDIHQQSRFPLMGAHRQVSCTECHKSSSNLQYDIVSIECIDCHLKDFQNTISPNHVQGGFSTNCIECHTENSINWNTEIIDHSFFPLTAGHAVGCTQCHTSGKFEKIPADCYSCHLTNFNSAQVPSHINAGITKDCETCHTTTAWKPSTFNHITTGFELTGSHRNVVQCSECHTGNLTSANPLCLSCHQAQYNIAPDHKSKGYPTDCAMCHNTNNWLEATFDHNKTHFPLTGAHKTTECSECHTSGFTGTPSACNSCHLSNFNSAQVPSHINAGITKDCETCHTTTAWKPSTFNHITTGFELTGSHRNVVQCSECHKGNLTGANPLCLSCHQVQYDTAPKHKSGGYPTDCAMCHNTNNWLEATFDHNKTHFPLTGAHKTTECVECHTSGFTGTPTACNSCHLTNFNSAQLPNHINAGITKDCETCHTTTAWKPSTFNHITTGFELTGGHRNVVQCSECHKGNLTSANAECLSCHQTQYNTAPNHKSGGYPTDCAMCHNTNNWLEATFDHNKTHFPLTGAHKTTECAECHTSGFTGTPTACNSCHLTNFNTAQVPSHINAGITKDCETCHTTTVWKPSTFNHITTGFELTGSHRNVVQCSECHKGNLTSANPLCISCHQVQYDTAPKHKSGGYPTDCAMCHNTNNWLEATFDHSKTSFPLTGAHKTTECAECHKSGFSGTPMACNSCHLTNFNSAQVPSHINAGITKDCETCHTTTAWKPSSFNHTTTGFELTGSHRNVVQCSECHTGNLTSANPLCLSCHQVQYDTAPKHKSGGYPTDCAMCHNTNNWLEASFDHNKTHFPLTGAHKTTECAECHKSGFSGTPMACNSCHLTNFNSAQVPSHINAGITKDCETCHTTTAWKPSTFNHITTGFELTGSHRNVVQCSECHKGNLTSVNPLCISCHQVQYDTAPKHKSGGYPTDCAMCHNTNNWLEATFDHSKTSFPLTGAHKTTECAECHKSGFTGTPMACNSCHLTNFNSAQVPSHINAGITKDCETCHTTTAWKPSTFNHITTGFELTGSHRNVVQCSECHKGNLTSANPLCISCHQVQYDTAPKHKSGGYPTDCAMCHNTNNWLEATFDHSKTSFPLTGAHKTTECSECHTSGFTGTPSACNSCHLSNFNSAQVPSHINAGITKDCETCHTTTAWKPSTFNHTTTGFELTGSHRNVVQCSECHKGNLTSANPLCISCHQVQYDTAPKHKSGGYPTDCAMCHNTNNWLEATFDHSKTSFPLTGAHKTTECAECHKSGFTGTPSACNSCHLTNFNSAQVPSHINAGITKDCETCHTTTAWKPSTFNHITTGFELTGSHRNVVQCSECHKGNLTSANPLCISCHQVQYDTAPKHKSGGYPTDCAMCHNTNNWLESTFDHSKTNFPLKGAHTSVNCSSCHTSGFTGTSTLCYSCHATNYKNTTNPNHSAAKFPTDCESCHTVNSWSPSTFNHDSQYFPIYSGNHRGEWNTCADCHTNTSNFSVFACINCHEHNKTSTDKDHKGVKGYSYTSAACYSCHPLGRAD